MKRHLIPFGDEIVRLRLIEERDLETTLSWRNRDDARIWFKTSDPIPLESHKAWFQRYFEKDDDFLFIVEVPGHPARPIGQVAVYDIDWIARNAEVGRFLVAPDDGGKGYMARACQALIDYCSDRLGLDYVFLEVLERNERARRLYERSGFSEEDRHDGLIRMGRSIGPKRTRVEA
jgi:diamine N-acetyltransferase